MKRGKKPGKEPPEPIRLTAGVKWLMAGVLVFLVVLYAGGHWYIHRSHQHRKDTRFQTQWGLTDGQMEKANEQLKAHRERYQQLNEAFEMSRRFLMERKATGAPEPEIQKLLEVGNEKAEDCWKEEMKHIGILAGLMAPNDGERFRKPYETRHHERKKDATGLLVLPHGGDHR